MFYLAGNRAQKLADAMKRRRGALGISAAEAARRGNVAYAGWRSIEKGDRDGVREATLVGIATGLDWSRQQLVEAIEHGSAAGGLRYHVRSPREPAAVMIKVERAAVDGADVTDDLAEVEGLVADVFRGSAWVVQDDAGAVVHEPVDRNASMIATRVAVLDRRQRKALFRYVDELARDALAGRRFGDDDRVLDAAGPSRHIREDDGGDRQGSADQHEEATVGTAG